VRARAYLLEAAGLRGAIGNPLYVPWCLEGLAAVLAAEGRAADAARLCGAGDALIVRVGGGLPPVDPAGHAATLATVLAGLGDTAFSAAHEVGRALSPEEAIAVAESGP
jgi:hypothetical protein